MLATPTGRVNGLAFLAGWLGGLTLLGCILLLVAGGGSASHHGSPATWVSVVKIVVGILLFLVAVREWRGRPRGGEEPPLPKWMQAIDEFTPARSAGMAVLLAAVQPKNFLLVVGAATAIAQTGASGGSQAVALAVFVIIATLGVGAPVAIYYLMGERAPGSLTGCTTGWSARTPPSWRSSA
jgi:hypothetical protein